MNDTDLPAFTRGQRLLAGGAFAEALTAFDAALAEEASADAHAGRGSALFGLRRFGDAVEAYEAALALRPDDADLLLGHALAIYENGDNDGAIEVFDAFLAM